MALENKKLSSYDDLASANIDTTTKLVVLTGATKVNANLPVTNFIEDTLTSTSVVKPLSAKQGKALQDTKAPIDSPKFTGAVNGITKAMVGLGNVDNTSDANKPISIAQAAGLAPKANPVFTGSVTMEDLNQETTIGGVQIASIQDLSFYAPKANPVFTGLQTFADNTAAAALPIGTVYMTPTGQLMIKY